MWAPCQSDWCHRKRRKLDTQRHQGCACMEGGPCEDTQEGSPLQIKQRRLTGSQPWQHLDLELNLWGKWELYCLTTQPGVSLWQLVYYSQVARSLKESFEIFGNVFSNSNHIEKISMGRKHLSQWGDGMGSRTCGRIQILGEALVIGLCGHFIVLHYFIMLYNLHLCNVICFLPIMLKIKGKS